MRNIISKSGQISHSLLSLLLLFYTFQASCKKDNQMPVYQAGSNQYINNWILDSMKVYYYWNNTIPSKPDLNLSPPDFFLSIKNSGDQFSRLTNPAVRESYYPSLVHNFGFELVVYEENTGEIKTVVALTVPGTKAHTAGIERGSIITSINGIKPSGGNIAELIQSSIAQRKITVDIEKKSTIALGAELVSENPVYLYKTFQDRGKSIAYLFYNSFEGRSKYALQEAFASFKAADATELILDLRYNPGGDVGMSAALAAVLSNVNQSDVFVEYRGNNKAGIRRESFEKTISKINLGYSFSFEELKLMRLPLSRIFVLTGAHTASAAEFLIKGLRPWTNVIQVGGTTLGKDMASFSISDPNSSKNNSWSLEAMIFKLYNSKSEGNYPDGLIPDIFVSEFSDALVPFGDLNDPLIKSAFAQISPGARVRSVRQSLLPRVLYDSRMMVDKSTGMININSRP